MSKCYKLLFVCNSSILNDEKQFYFIENQLLYLIKTFD
jgi:hypothetical protein